MKKSTRAVGSGLVAILMANVAHAQTVEPQAISNEQSAAPAADGQEPVGVADIVVTAQRRSENLQRAAVAVSAVTGDQLTSASISDVNNLGKLVPSLVVQPQGGATTNFYLRGVGTFGTNAFSENAVAFNFAGVYIARPTSPLGTLFDLERVEVVKGPQGTLYGRNATGGAINVIPTRPTLGEVTAKVAGEYGNFDTRKLSGAVNIPLGSQFALRLAGQMVDRDGYLSDGYDDENGQAARVSLLFKPDSTFSMLLIGDYFRQRGKGVGSVIVPGVTAPTAPSVEDRVGGADPRSLAELSRRFPALINPGLVEGPRNDGFLNNDFYGVTLITEADLGFATLSVIPAYRRSEPDFRTYNNGSPTRVTEVDDQMSLEVKLASNTSGPLKYVLGAYHFSEKQEASNSFSQGRIATTVFNPFLETTSSAAFAQFTYGLSDTLRLVAGGRYTSEHKTLRTQLRLFSPAEPNPAPTNISGDLKFDRFTWKAGFEWDAGDRNLIYANVATGFKAGGFFVSVVDNTTRPERLTAYTLGSKNRFLDNRLQMNAELFYWDYRDQQVNFIGPAQYAPRVYGPGGVTVNAGQARMYGADFDILFQPTSADRFAATLQYLNSKYTSFTYDAYSANGLAPRSGCGVSPSASVPVNAPARLFRIDCTGRPAQNAPRWTASVGYDHRFDLGELTLTPGVRARVESSRFLAIDYLPEEKQDGYAMFDIDLTLARQDRWSLTGFVNNVTDETVLASAIQRGFIPVVYSALRPPRTYGVRASISY